MERQLTYADGDLIAVPLVGGGYAVGLIVAHDRRGGIIAYFFDQRYDTLPTIDGVGALGHAEVLRVMRFGDLGLLKGGWRVIGQHPEWRRGDWSIPAFGRREITGQAFRVVYSSTDLRSPIREEIVTDDECDQLPRDALSGSVAVERVLTQLLSKGIEL